MSTHRRNIAYSQWRVKGKEQGAGSREQGAGIETQGESQEKEESVLRELCAAPSEKIVTASNPTLRASPTRRVGNPQTQRGQPRAFVLVLIYEVPQWYALVVPSRQEKSDGKGGPPVRFAGRTAA